MIEKTEPPGKSNSDQRELYAHGYDSAQTLKLHASRTADKQAGWFLPYLQPGMTLLDCGCATGSITVGLAKVVAPGQVTGVDISDIEIERAQARAAEAGAIGDYEFLKSRARSNEALLFDEGFIHRVVQFYGSAAEEPNPKRISRYVNLLPKPDYVIFVNAPAEICERRIYERGIWERLQNKSKQEVTTFVANCGTCVKFAVEQICRNGWSVIAVDNSGDAPAPATRALRRALSLVPLNGQGH
jgi:SAM-dependent methyltransferase